MRVELLGYYGSDLMVANCARTSFDRQHEAFTEGDARLIRFLAREGHHSPFFHPQATLRISAAIPIARQLLRHQVGLAVSEVSRRYVRSSPEFEALVWRASAPDVKQGSAGALSAAEQADWTAIYDQHCRNAVRAYEAMLESGVAPEQARFILPQGMLTTWTWTGSLFAFARVCRERLAPDAQSEVRDVARAIARIMSGCFHHSWAALVPQEAA